MHERGWRHGLELKGPGVTGTGGPRRGGIPGARVQPPSRRSRISPPGRGPEHLLPLRKAMGGKLPPSPGAAGRRAGNAQPPPAGCRGATQGFGSVAQAGPPRWPERSLSPAAPATWSSPDDGVTTEGPPSGDLIHLPCEAPPGRLTRTSFPVPPVHFAAVSGTWLPSRNASPRGRAFYQILKWASASNLWA